MWFTKLSIAYILRKTNSSSNCKMCINSKNEGAVEGVRGRQPFSRKAFLRYKIGEVRLEQRGRNE